MAMIGSCRITAAMSIKHEAFLKMLRARVADARKERRRFSSSLPTGSASSSRSSPPTRSDGAACRCRCCRASPARCRSRSGRRSTWKLRQPPPSAARSPGSSSSSTPSVASPGPSRRSSPPSSTPCSPVARAGRSPPPEPRSAAQRHAQHRNDEGGRRHAGPLAEPVSSSMPAGGRRSAPPARSTA